MFVTYYTRQDLNGDIAGMVELHSIGGDVFVDWDDYIVAWNNQGQEAA